MISDCRQLTQPSSMLKQSARLNLPSLKDEMFLPLVCLSIGFEINDHIKCNLHIKRLQDSGGAISYCLGGGIKFW